MNESYIFRILFYIIFLVISILFLLIYLNNVKLKKLKEDKLIKCNYDEDFKLLLNLIEIEITYTKKIIIPNISIKKDVKIFIEEDLEEIIRNNILNITDKISSKYKKLLSLYIKDLDLYLVDRLRKEYEEIFLVENIKKINGVNNR